MALKNYTTEVPANRSIAEIQEMLQKHGVSGVMMEYDPQGTGRIESLAFKIDINGQPWGFKMPLRWRQALDTLYRGKRAPRYYRQSQQEAALRTREDHSYRVAWRILRDWVDVQMALVDLEIVQVQEVFLPYVVQRNGQVVKIEPQKTYSLYGKNGGRICTHRPDFTVTWKDGHIEIWEAKGMSTPVFNLKLKLFEDNYPELTYYVITPRQTFQYGRKPSRHNSGSIRLRAA